MAPSFVPPKGVPLPVPPSPVSGSMGLGSVTVSVLPSALNDRVTTSGAAEPIICKTNPPLWAIAGSAKIVTAGTILSSMHSRERDLLANDLVNLGCLVFLNQLLKPRLRRKDILRSPDHSLGRQDFAPYEISDLSRDSPCLTD